MPTLLRQLDTIRGVTVAMVLHDLNEAFRYADHQIAMQAGAIVGEGAPGDIVAPGPIRDVFGVDCLTIPDPVTGPR